MSNHPKFPVCILFCFIFYFTAISGQRDRDRDRDSNPTTFNIGGVLSSNASKGLFKETIDVSNVKTNFFKYFRLQFFIAFEL